MTVFYGNARELHSELDAKQAVAAAQLDYYPDLLTVKDICALTGRDAQSIRRLIRKGVLPGKQLGRYYYIAKRDFINLFAKESHRVS